MHKVWIKITQGKSSEGPQKEPPWGKALQMRFLWPDISKEKQFQFAHAATQWGNTTNVTCVKLCDLGIALLRSTCLSTQERNLNIDQFQWWFSARAFVALNRRKKVTYPLFSFASFYMSHAYPHWGESIRVSWMHLFNNNKTSIGFSLSRTQWRESTQVHTMWQAPV